MDTCDRIIISSRAYNAILSETSDKISTETGGILLGRVIGRIWFIIESIDPGPNSVFEISHFEYDTEYVNYLAKVLSKQYKEGLAVLGLWHRHPGSLDTFSHADDITNSEFVRLSGIGAISALVNIDPVLRLTIYHVTLPLKYNKLSFEVNDSLISENLLEYKYFSAKKSSFRFVEVDPIKPKKSKLFTSIKGIFGTKKNNRSSVNEITNHHSNLTSNQQEDVDNYLIELYSKEEYHIESILRVRYESEIMENSIEYTINEFVDGKKILPKISFEVSFNKMPPVFYCEKNSYPFKEGIFTRYVNSRLNKEEFKG